MLSSLLHILLCLLVVLGILVVSAAILFVLQVVWGILANWFGV